MGASDVKPCRRGEQARAFQRAVLEDLRALAWMLERGLVESAPVRVGAEQELFLVAEDGAPAPVAAEVLARLGEGPYSHEVGLFDLEANLTARMLGGASLSELERETRELVARATAAAAQEGAHLLLCGILPSVTRQHLRPELVTPSVRFDVLSDATLRAQGGELRPAIRGIDDLELRLDNMMLDACTASFQVHLQVAPETFAAVYNAGQLALAPVLAMAACSPLLLGKRLWRETRVPLVEQVTRMGTVAAQRRGGPPRADFGTRWVERSPVELHLEDLARHAPVLVGETSEQPFEALRHGRAPLLAALAIHNGTVWRWNRACYGITEGKPHLRIEMRALPAGPTVVDQVANASLWLGLTLAFARELPDLPAQMRFEDARSNFYEAARRGIDSRLLWLDGARHDACALVLGELLPAARRGLLEAGVNAADVERYLGIIEQRAQTRRSGSQWMLDSFDAMQGPAPLRARAVAAQMQPMSLGEQPVHTWAVQQLEPATGSGTPLSLLAAGQPVALQPHDAVELAAELLRAGQPLVPVEDERGTLLGVVDLEAVDEARTGVPVSEVMVRDFPSARGEASVGEAVVLLLRADQPALVVLDAAGRLLDVLGMEQLLRALVRDGPAPQREPHAAEPGRP